MRRNNLVIGIYYHPEAYPPTLNAVHELSECFDRIGIIHRPHLKGTWKYPANVSARASGSYITSSGQQQASTPKKIRFFLQFVSDLLKECRSKKPRVILLYDSIALYAYNLIRPFLFFKHKLWYHNHDITEMSLMRKYSVGWFAGRSEGRSFKKIDIFTLPSVERLPYFPMKDFMGKYFIIPNYPSLAFYGPFYQAGKADDIIKLIFQGRIDNGHGLEVIIPLLAQRIKGKELNLVLKGHIEESYKGTLMNLARECNVTDKVSFAGFTAYEEVPKLASTCHIGIGIFAKKEVMHVTLGTASNKLYEYAALGLPVLYSNEEHFSRYLQSYEWAFAVDATPDSIKSQLEIIIKDYVHYSKAAHISFSKELNFEKYFESVKQFIKPTAVN